MHYELWDTETGNLVGAYDTEDEALAVVRNAVRSGGAATVETLALGLDYEDEGGGDEALPPVLSGAALVARAQAVDSQECTRDVGSTVSESTPAKVHTSR